ncbi:MAG: PLDc N-terminal domain-containing protein [Coriobacteriales bacterium]|jgi:uncharacterized membrane protein YsdA (DUF1294 family)|nr:PLDc N-terminal domain-containing protein [Coriobacteriales bacterium]
MSINTDFGAGMEIMLSMLPFLIPLIIIQLGLMIAALISIFRHKTYKNGNRVLWVVVVILINTIGPILYFILGRGDE